MNVMLVSIFLPLLLLLQVSVPVTSRLLSAHVTSYRKSRTTVNGPVRCALDSANKTSSSSSLQDCSLDCARDGTCIGFNIKNSLTCDVYNYNPKMTGLVSDCAFYQVNNSLNCLFTCWLYLKIGYFLCVNLLFCRTWSGCRRYYCARHLNRQWTFASIIRWINTLICCSE